MDLESLFLYSAVGGGVVLLAQLAMMTLGGDHADHADFGDVGDGGADHHGGHHDGDASDHSGFWFFEMVSLRTLAAAATFFGLVGGAVNAAGAAPVVSLVIAGLAGYGAMYAVYWAFRQLFRLETSGNEDVYNAIGETGEVYLPIGASGGHAGKVHVTVQGRTAEYQALTDSDRPLPTGAKVLVMEVVSGDTVKVQPVGLIES